jgi:hypothetical protein
MDPLWEYFSYEDIPLDGEIRFDILDVSGKLQITANQIVILLDKVGFFIKKISLKSQAKQSEVISKVTGLNVKNIATYISDWSKTK